MIAYFKCLCRSSDKVLAKRYKEQGIEVRVTKNNTAYRDEAAKFKTKMPFLVDNGVVVS